MRKTLAMRLTAIVILTATLHCTAAGYTQNNITLKETNAPLEKLLLSIRKQSGYAIVYTKQMLQQSTLVTVDLQKVSLTEALDACLSKQPLEYTIVNKTIVLKAKATTLKTQSDPPGEITGRVTNEQGEPLAGASVILKRTGKGDIADANGNFKLRNANADDVVEISFTGYKTHSAKVGGAGLLTLVLDVAVDELDRAVIQAYGKTTQRLATGNIAKVTAAEIKRQPVMNPLLALQGKVAGLNVTQTTGFASSPVKVELRGRSAVSNSLTSDPLYVIDGVPLTVLELGTTSYATGSPGFIQSGISKGPANGQSPLFNINSDDIESIEVLKDADATAIYGSRGANGVILINTKKGKAGNSQFNLNVQHGFTKATRFASLLDTKQYVEMRREAYQNDGNIPTEDDGYDLLIWDTTRYTDWQRKLYDGLGKKTSIQASLMGGNTQTTYRIGAAYNRTTNILAVSGADQQSFTSVSLSHNSTDQKLKISLAAQYSNTKTDITEFPAVFTLAPNAPDIYDSLGNLNYKGWGGATNNYSAISAFPFAALKQPYKVATSFLNSNFIVSYQLLKSLTVRSSFGFNNAQADQQSFNPIAAQNPLDNRKGSSRFGYNNNRNWIIEPQISYDALISRGKFSVLFGGSFQQTTTNGNYMSGDGYVSDELITSIANAPRKNSSDRHGFYKYTAAFVRLNYIWNNRYVFNATARRDGSSRFGPSRHFGNFGSVGGAWIFTEQTWFKNHLSFISYGKLRASYGLTGSDGGGDYGYLTRWSSNNTEPYFGSSVIVPTQHANPYYHWQTNKKLELAVDVSFLQNRINTSFAWYRNRCGDQLISFPTPALSGFTSVIANSPALVENTGVEFNLSAKLVRTHNFNWSINFNASRNYNKLVAYPDLQFSPFVDQYVVGKPLNIVKSLHYIGVDPATGQYMFEDMNKDGQITMTFNNQPDDRYVQEISPAVFGGMGMDFSFKKFSASLLFSMKKQNGRNIYKFGNYAGTVNQNQPIEVLDRWQLSGDITGVARFTAGGASTDRYFLNFSDAGYTDASFIRLSNLSVGYNFSSNFLQRAHIRELNLFFNTNNLFVITRYKGLDPEIQSFGTLPLPKTMVLGLDVNF